VEIGTTDTEKIEGGNTTKVRAKTQMKKINILRQRKN